MQDSEIEKAPAVTCSEDRSFEHITDQELESCFLFQPEKQNFRSFNAR